MGNKPYENDRLFMFQEMFSNMNKEHSNRFSAVEKVNPPFKKGSK